MSDGGAVANGGRSRSAGRLPWQASVRATAQRVGLDPRYVRRVRWLRKARAVRQCDGSIVRHWRFVLCDPEPDNFTYEIANDRELAEWVAQVAGCDLPAAEAYVDEPQSDVDLAARLRQATARRWLWTKASPPFGKRVGWYALARAIRPRVAIETGVHDGLGSLLLLRALERNASEGYPGRLVSFDINPAAGWLVGAHPLWDLRIQSSADGLPAVLAAHEEVDLFVYDGWHSHDAERADLVTVRKHLSPHGILLSDDAQVTRALADVCQEESLGYLEFHERPSDHFYPGAALGAGRA